MSDIITHWIGVTSWCSTPMMKIKTNMVISASIGTKNIATLSAARRALVHQKTLTLHFQSVSGFASAEPIRLPTQ